MTRGSSADHLPKRTAAAALDGLTQRGPRKYAWGRAPSRPWSYTCGLPGPRTWAFQDGARAPSSRGGGAPSFRGHPRLSGGYYPAVDAVRNLPSAPRPSALPEPATYPRRAPLKPPSPLHAFGPPPLGLAVQTAVVTRPSHLEIEQRKPLCQSHYTATLQSPGRSLEQKWAPKRTVKFPTFR